jgi:transposase
MIAVGVDSHNARHVAAALDELGQVLGDLSIEASEAGYRALAAWAAALGDDVVFGSEGAGSDGRPDSQVPGRGVRARCLDRR